MRRVSTRYLQPGMTVARTIYSSNGKVLLAAGMRITPKYIKRLVEVGIASVYVKDSLLGELDNIPDVLSEKSRLETTQLVKDSFLALETNQRINIKAVREIVDSIIDELLANRDVLFHLTDIRSYDDYTFSHSVNVCLLALMTAITLGYDQLKMKELGIGALLHDIGKIRVSKEILTKPGQLTPEEHEVIRQHPQYGYEILRTYDDVPLLSAHVSLQHHERWDGKGYPRGLSGEQIHEHARIVAVADVYDALLADRPYRPAYSVNQAVTIISRMSKTYFQPRTVAALVSNIAVFPIGSVVMLSSGHVGVVVDVNKNAPTRPIIKVLFDQYSNQMLKPHEIDLTRLNTVFISKVLSDEEIFALLKTDSSGVADL
ncbi:MAG: HD-GYP domain-containing protein [Bacillota bacterium]